MWTHALLCDGSVARVVMTGSHRHSRFDAVHGVSHAVGKQGGIAVVVDLGREAETKAS